ncbi:hypothetical protein Anapl_17914 [Anas platyrhynchos]|uniref:Uncharacterized protein n=1 Tax=Anas platyrhynchos TaxID=8839 RepID=R0J7N2_ANAPL|nr:hypothetical protein Anapl_17914 [Anas platyrhynchos]
MGPARCACADRTGQAGRPPARRRAVLLRGAHTRSQGKAEAKAVPWVAAVKHFRNLDTQRNGNPLQPVVEHERGPFRLCLISSCFSDMLLNHGNGRAHLQAAKPMLPSREGTVTNSAGSSNVVRGNEGTDMQCSSNVVRGIRYWYRSSGCNNVSLCFPWVSKTSVSFVSFRNVCPELLGEDGSVKKNGRWLTFVGSGDRRINCNICGPEQKREFPNDTLINSSCCQMLFAFTFRTVCINNKYLHLEIIYTGHCSHVTATGSGSGLGTQGNLASARAGVAGYVQGRDWRYTRVLHQPSVQQCANEYKHSSSVNYSVIRG